MNDKKRKSPFPRMGLAAAGFAAVLVVFSMDAPNETAQKAVKWFALGIPLAVAAPAVWYTRERIHNEAVLVGLFYFAALVGGVGDIACLGGIYWLFKSVSPDAATMFLRVCIGAYLLWSLSEIGLDMADESRRRKEAAAERAAHSKDAHLS